jgi:general secretion pathway protein K
MALVLTLMVLTIITAMVVEFAYGVYVNTTLLYNWQAAQKLSLLANSGASLAAKFVTADISQRGYTYPGSVALPPQDPLGDGNFVSLLIEDENAKFNLNTLLNADHKTIGDEPYEAFRRLLLELSLEEDIADLVADWMDKDTVPFPAGSERETKNAPLDSVEELLLIPGMDREIYDTLLPYVTVYGGEDALRRAYVNINGASVPVLMSLSEAVSPEMAQRVVDFRESKPFSSVDSLYNDVAGFEHMRDELTGKITVKGKAFRLEITASLEDGLSTVIHCVIDSAGVVKYWKET